MAVADAATTSSPAARTLASRLPGFPWDRLAPASARAAAHPDGIADLSIGTPVDPVPAIIQDALSERDYKLSKLLDVGGRQRPGGWPAGIRSWSAPMMCFR